MNRKIFSNRKVLAAISAIAITLFASSAFFQNNDAETLIDDGILKAVIIDQLYDDIPNEYFQTQATKYLETAGYEVDLVTTQDVTVDFYKNLPSMNYDYIVVRTHGVSQRSQDSVTLFTGERYQEDKYISEQLLGTVKRGAPLQTVSFLAHMGNATMWITINNTYSEITIPAEKNIQTTNDYFLITPKLVNDLMVGKFPGSIFLLGGCSTLENPSMAEALIKRGASSVVGWDDIVGDIENDVIMLALLKKNLVENKDIDESIDLLMESYDWGSPAFNATLRHYTAGTI